MTQSVNLETGPFGRAYDAFMTGERSMFEQSPLPMWMYDRATLAFVAVNEAAIRHYGYSREEFLARTIADIRPPDELPALHEAVEAATAGLGTPRIWHHQKKDGTTITVEIVSNDFAIDGRPVRLVLVNDITAREQTERALREAEAQLHHAQKTEAIGRLSGAVAHDFNNLLTVIGSYACLLEEGSAETVSADAAEIRSAVERAAVITRKLLTLSRHSIAAPHSLDLNAVIAGFGPTLQRLIGEQIQLVVRPGEIPKVIVDPGQIEQVVMNLAINARDAMGARGRLTIETHVIEVDEEAAAVRLLRVGRHVVIAVTDTGSGMDPDTQRKIFDPFFTTKAPGQGTGLGLSIVHGIVEQAGGAVTVYSEPGNGTTFRVHLPVAEETIDVVAPVRAVEAPLVLPPIKVLIVDDDAPVRAVAARILRAAGCQILEAGSADEARRLCVSHEGVIDLVLLDVVLSDARGDRLVQELRQLRPCIDVVLMSGYPAGALDPRGGTPHDLLAKPFSPAELRGAIARGLAPRCESSVPPLVTSPTTHRSRVLVADDDRAVRGSIARILRRADLDVVEVESGPDALRELEAGAFDVIVSDVHMPGGGGLDLLRAVRRLDLDVPVILISGAPDVTSASSAVEYGAFRYLTKPVDNDVLTKLVQHAGRAHTLARLRREVYAVSGTHAGAADRAGLEVRFGRALDAMWMAFQPIVEARTGALYGVEALLRSDEPSMPDPQLILDAATELGALPLLGRRIRALCAASAAALPEELTMFVNLHPEDLEDSELLADDAPLTRIAPRIILEITERSTLRSTPALTQRLARLRSLGYRLAVDDIGAGYSGLTSFTELMPEVVKIDLALVRDVHKSSVKQRTIAALINLCHEVGCVVVAEGVETEDERRYLLELGCDLFQGYLFGRPARELPRTHG